MFLGDLYHYDYVIMTMLASQITSLTVVYLIVYSGVNQRKHQSSASLAFVWEIHRGPVNFPHKWPVTRKMFPFDDVIMLHLVQVRGWHKNENTQMLHSEPNPTNSFLSELTPSLSSAILVLWSGYANLSMRTVFKIHISVSGHSV